MRTTLDLPDPLFKEVKTRAVQQGVTLKELLATYIEAGLRSPPAAETSREVARNPHPIPIGIARVPGTPLHPALTNTELNAILDQEDLYEYQRVLNQSSATE